MGDLFLSNAIATLDVSTALLTAGPQSYLCNILRMERENSIQRG
jgi:hypothetical protein